MNREFRVFEYKETLLCETAIRDFPIGSIPSILGGRMSVDPEGSRIENSEFSSTRKSCRVNSRYAISRCDLSRPSSEDRCQRSRVSREIGVPESKTTMISKASISREWILTVDLGRIRVSVWEASGFLPSEI